MIAPIFIVCAASPPVVALLGGDTLRLYPFGQQDDNVVYPYVVWQNITGSPENYLAQTIIRDTVIGDGTISNAKIGNYIQSNNYVANTSGWHINKAGTFYINGSAGTGRMVISNTLIQIYDNNNVLRVRMGLW